MQALPERRDERPRSTIALLLMLAALGLGLRTVGVVRPWDGRDFHSALGALGPGSYATNFALNGFAEAKLMPYHWRVERADGTVEHSWYPHHPAGYPLVTGVSLAVFGREKWALQLPSLIFSVLSILAVFRLGRSLYGERTAWIAAALTTLLPMGVYYGIVTWAEPLIVWLHVEILVSYVRWRGTSERALPWRTALLVFAGGLLDWSSFFLLPGLCLHLALGSLRRTERWRLAAIGLWGGAALSTIALHRLHMHWVIPSGHAEDTSDTLAWVTSLNTSMLEFLRAQGRYLVRYYTTPVLAITALGLVWQLAGLLRPASRDRGRPGLVLTAVCPALLYVGLFPARSINHDFFWYLALPYVSLTAAVVLARALALAGHWRVPAATSGTLLVAGLAWCGWRGLDLWLRQDTRRMPALVGLPALQSMLHDRANILLTGNGHGMLLHFYSDAPLISGLDRIAELENLRRELLLHTSPERPVLYLFDTQFRELYPGPHAYLERNAASVRRLEAYDVQLEVFDLSDWARSAGQG